MPKTITCIPTGVQHGSKRFPVKSNSPTIKAWRCDLTALSKVSNLYFLASNDTIHVYEPAFPDQRLQDEPELILHPPTSLSTKYGIDPDDPHSITRLHVDYLGYEEILLAACDDGDVIGYRVSDIQGAVDRHKAAKESEPNHVCDCDEVRTFYRQNVGGSAWGLAVNRKARMIAISANTHRINVIVFALSEPGGASDASTSSESVYPPLDVDLFSDASSAYEFPISRKHEHELEMASDSNMPSITFCNTSHDPTGRWLVASTIDGKTTIWDLEDIEGRHRNIQLGWCASAINQWKSPRTHTGQCACPDRDNVPHSAWGAMFLDTSSAYPVSALGDAVKQPVDLPPCFKDVSAYRSDFSVKKEKPSFGPVPPESVTMSDEEEDSSDMVIQDEEEESTYNISTLPGNGADQTTSVPSSLNVHAPSAALPTEFDFVTFETANEGHTPDADSLFVPGTQSDLNQPLEVLDFPMPWSDPEPIWDGSESEYEDLTIPHDNPVDGSLLDVFNYFTAAKAPYCEINKPNFPKKPANIPTASPLLIMTREEIFLVQHPFKQMPDGKSLGPITCMRRPLHPDNKLRFLHPGDRMCFFHEIPELGVFIVASPVGRAGIFCTTCAPGADGSLEYGFKLEYLLPFEASSENEVYDVPYERLAGVAVGPVQGMFDKPEDVEREGVEDVWGMQPRRWRVIMYYTDHTVLSFEIAKRRVGGEPGVGDLVV